ncbi:uncharacterized protein [Haliotis cracherodii]|uniref:uncharacterized protein n=1 Tax=Haliotis cracherodii TaxID=6455 RepID=UPI0039E7E219
MSTMFHSSHIHVPRSRRPNALRTFVTSSSFGPTETKEPLRRGIMFTTVASVLLLVGSILTWLGFSDVFGDKVSMTGPLLIALALLLLLLSMRQFVIARKRNNSTRNGLQLGQMGRGTVTAVVVDRNDGLGAVTVIMDALNVTPDTQMRSYASSTGEDCAPPSYSEVTQENTSTIPPGHHHPDQDEPPPPYEEAVGVELSSSTLNRSSLHNHTDETTLPAYTSWTPGCNVDTPSNTLTIPGQVAQCYRRCTFPTQPGIETSGGGHQLTSLATGQTLTTAELTQGANGPWSSSGRFFLIPHFLGVLANRRGDPAASMTGELPPAYQAVDTTGSSPLTYLQAMSVGNQHGPPQDHLGVQSPHESRSLAHPMVPDHPVDTYHLPPMESNQQGVVPNSSFPNSSLTTCSLPGSAETPSSQVCCVTSSSLPNSSMAASSLTGIGVTGSNMKTSTTPMPSIAGCNSPPRVHHGGVSSHPSSTTSPSAAARFLQAPRNPNSPIIDELEEVV